MKRLLITAAALAVFAAPAAFADDQNNHNKGNNSSGGQGSHSSSGQGSHSSNSSGGQGGHGGAGGGNGGSGAAGGHGGNTVGVGAGSNNHVGFFPTNPSSGGNGAGNGNGNGAGNGNANFRAGAFQGRGGNGPSNAGPGRGPGRGPTVNLHQNIPSLHRYRGPVFHWPGGFGYRRFSYGDFLPGIFLGENYWIYDYDDYDLPYPPPGLAWVRYGPDALLVDRHTGEVDEVVYGVFY